MVPKAAFEEFGKLKPMFCGDCAAKPIFWVRVGLLKDGDVDNVLSWRAYILFYYYLIK